MSSCHKHLAYSGRIYPFPTFKFHSLLLHIDVKLTPSLKMNDRSPFRPRRPSPPPKGSRAREPPSPDLFARSLPSSATLNALPMLSRTSSELNVASVMSRFSQSSYEESGEEWLMLPNDTLTRQPSYIKKALALKHEPEFRYVVIKPYTLTPHHHYCYTQTPKGEVLAQRPDASEPFNPPFG